MRTRKEPKITPIEWLVAAIVTFILAFGVWPGNALAAPAYSGGCVQRYGNGSWLTSMYVYGAQWVDQRVHDGNTYTGWVALGKVGTHTWRGNYVYPYNHNIEVQYAIGNSNGWAYGHVAYINPYESTPPCG